MMLHDKDLSRQIEKWGKLLENRIDGHDAQLAEIYEAMENLLDKEADAAAEKKEWQNRKRIGFKP